MTGFECTVTNALPSSTARVAKGVPPRYCGGKPSACVAGPKQPMYWANDSPNIAFLGEYEQKPSYNEKWGFKHGAQNDIFDGAGGPPPSNPGPGPTPSSTIVVPVPSEVTGSKWSWAGHCKGASCKDQNDRSDDLTCQQGQCA